MVSDKSEPDMCTVILNINMNFFYTGRINNTLIIHYKLHVLYFELSKISSLLPYKSPCITARLINMNHLFFMMRPLPDTRPLLP